MNVLVSAIRQSPQPSTYAPEYQHVAPDTLYVQFTLVPVVPITRSREGIPTPCHNHPCLYGVYLSNVNTLQIIYRCRQRTRGNQI